MKRDLSGGRGGFTLVELLIVVAIIAILAGVAVPWFVKYRLRSFKAELDSDAKNIYTAAQTYLFDNPLEIVDTLAKIKTGGYSQSTNTVFDSIGMTQTTGNIKIYSNTLNARALDNNAVIFLNGRIDFVNAP
ncbi:MAG: hypothetical protein BMS9Abin23_0906 [Thermodesulfobacteriota bacterium]|nr:MAG: hypothetical protein BMS9Abin23_0906 [Thermodesulfobacteriota bacterium]